MYFFFNFVKIESGSTQNNQCDIDLKLNDIIKLYHIVDSSK